MHHTSEVMDVSDELIIIEGYDDCFFTIRELKYKTLVIVCLKLNCIVYQIH
jgi:hypothetical protein